jgi:hypothetical protein
LGSIVEFDASAILRLLTSIEEQLSNHFNDDGLADEHFSSVSSVSQFAVNKMS